MRSLYIIIVLMGFIPLSSIIPVIIILGNCYVYASLVLQSNLSPNQYHLKLVIEFVEDVHEISDLFPQY